MAKRIKWSTHAVADRIAILDYWFQRIGNKNYSRKLDHSLKEVINILSAFPKLGRQLDAREERFFVKDSYQIFYLETADSIEILHIWDSRRNPQDLNL
ncbi:type II toxin-antitoxin system RelE/ParE family toxin [uncultured Mucilaginibacter sp.]|uniref:type II toxin-antitoxin system RelE/ParE family toxin n=1 Tax=uncultured Mucilaginibacter sp. TaxID=797541 RepID=UPI002605636E|nr:type II toxin-antitoxin system RelE/ParE family toxin [uncultured Mucilaginibacter sp.]